VLHTGPTNYLTWQLSMVSLVSCN